MAGKIKKINIGYASCGIAAGVEPVYKAFLDYVGDSDIVVSKTGCVGMCNFEPMVDLVDEEGTIYRYKQVDDKLAQKIYNQHILKMKPIERALHFSTDFLRNQVRIVLRNTGRIDPEKIEEYEAYDGYKAMRKAVFGMTSSEVIEEVKKSGLRGRGGAGFPTGLKWSFAAGAKSDVKYIVCNADEGDPGAFMDRNVLESDPHSVIEGMLIAAYAIGAKQGYIYCRAEYPLAIHRLKIAIEQATEKGYLGDKIFGTDFSFHLKIKEGAGAFVCGEETALIASIEGKRGMPRIRPPFPANSGIFGKSTNINNVETLANIAWIINNGGDAFAEYGKGKSKGTKVFSVAGKIKYGGLVEVPMGMSLRELIYDVCKGIRDNKKFKAVQLGGPSGGCVPASLLDTPITYEDITETGAIMGSGGMVVVDENTCMVDFSKFFLQFTQAESCGKCTFCRLGTKRMLEIIDRITKGQGKMEDLDRLEELSVQIKKSSLCGLGQTAPNPVLTTLKFFKDEYIEHIQDHRCRAAQCKALIHYSIDPHECIRCGACSRACPTKAIFSEEIDNIHTYTIDDQLCTRCGSCISTCPVDAIKIYS